MREWKRQSAWALLCVAGCSLMVANAQAQNEAGAKKPAAKPAKSAEKPATPAAESAAKPQPATHTAYVRVLHALPEGAALDVWIDGQKVLSNVAFKSLSDYLPVSSGRRDIALSSAGTTTNVLHLEQTVNHDKFYTLVAYPVDGKPTLLAVNETTGKSVADKARLYGVNATVGATVDITKPSTRTKSGYAMLFKELEPGQAHSQRITPGKLTVQLRGSDHKAQGTQDITLEGNHRYTAFAVGSGTALSLVLAPAATQ